MRKNRFGINSRINAFNCSCGEFSQGQCGFASSTRYGLKEHLNYLCSVEPENETLRAALSIDMTDWTSMTGAIQNHSGNYSAHDASHSRRIISYIEKLLGEEQIALLSATDTWMIMSAAYSHDIGMYMSHSDMEKMWNSPDFMQYLVGIISNYPSESEWRKRVELFYDIGSDRLKSIGEAFDSIEASDADWMAAMRLSSEMRFLLTDYRRRSHAEASQAKLESGLKDTRNGIQNRLYRLIGKCSYGHSLNCEEVMDLLHKETDGYLHDHAHPRFVAMLLRMGDLMDIDNDRFDEYVIDTLPKMSRDSMLHKFKHACTSHILVSPEKIEVASDLTPLIKNGVELDDILETFKKTNDWYNWIEQELDYWRKECDRFLPDGFFFRVPRLTKREIILDGKATDRKDVEEEFSIDYNRAFEIIGEKNFYSAQLPFIREYIQNAFDAVKFQLIHSEDYDELIKKKLNAAEFLQESLTLLKGMRISVDIIRINKSGDNAFDVLFIFRDNGEGLTEGSYKRLQSVGDRTRRSAEKAKMLGWLRSTGEFGIGVHSAFAYTNTLRYRSFNEHLGCKFQLKLNSQKLQHRGSVIRIPEKLCDASARSSRGTDVWIRAKGSDLINTMFQKDIQRETVIEAGMLFDKLFVIIRSMIAPNIIPIRINFGVINEGEKIDINELLSFEKKHGFERCEKIPSFFNHLMPCRELPLDYKLFTIGDAAIYKTKCDDAYNVLYIDPSNPRQIENRNILVRIYRTYDVEALRVAFKGSWLIENDAVAFSLPGLNVELHILGRKAYETINSQRTRIMPEAMKSIHDDARRAIYYFIIFLAKPDNENMMLAFVRDNERLAFALTMYANCLLFELKRSIESDDGFRSLINETELKSLIDKLVDKCASFPEECYAYDISGNAGLRVDSPSGLSELLGNPTEAMYFAVDHFTLLMEKFADSSFDKDKLHRVFWIGLEDYEPNLTIARLDFCLDDSKSQNDPDAYVPVVKLTDAAGVECIEANDKATDLLLRKWMAMEIMRFNKPEEYKYHAYIPAVQKYESLMVFECDYNTSKEWRMCKSFIKMPQPKIEEGDAVKDGMLSDKYFEQCMGIINEWYPDDKNSINRKKKEVYYGVIEHMQRIQN